MRATLVGIQIDRQCLLRSVSCASLANRCAVPNSDQAASSAVRRRSDVQVRRSERRASMIARFHIERQQVVKAFHVQRIADSARASPASYREPCKRGQRSSRAASRKRCAPRSTQAVLHSRAALDRPNGHAQRSEGARPSSPGLHIGRQELVKAFRVQRSARKRAALRFGWGSRRAAEHRPALNMRGEKTRAALSARLSHQASEHW